MAADWSMHAGICVKPPRIGYLWQENAMDGTGVRCLRHESQNITGIKAIGACMVCVCYRPAIYLIGDPQQGAHAHDSTLVSIVQVSLWLKRGSRGHGAGEHRLGGHITHVDPRHCPCSSHRASGRGGPYTTGHHTRPHTARHSDATHGYSTSEHLWAESGIVMQHTAIPLASISEQSPALSCNTRLFH